MFLADPGRTSLLCQASWTNFIKHNHVTHSLATTDARDTLHGY